MKRIKDKIHALYVLLTAKEFALYTAQRFDNAKGSNCWVSYGVEEKYEGYDDFLNAINEFNTNFINKCSTD